ncbi:MAG: DUF2341 domain-containing protein, partial [Thermosphaera sp.]
MPCARLRITSQYDLSDYAVEVRLDNLGILDYVRDDGSDVYFLDKNDQPLYHAIWIVRKDKNYGSVFVRLTLQANVSRTISICYGEENPYHEYNRPDLVFALYDDFTTFDTTKWTVVDGTPTVENGHLVLRGATRDRVKTIQAFKDVEVRVYYYFESFGTYGPRFSVEVRRQDNTFYAFMNEQRAVGWGNFYSIGKVIDEAYTTIAVGSRTSYYTTNVYYEEVYRIIGSSLKWTVQGYMDNRETLSATDTEIATEGTVAIRAWDSGNDVRVDKVFIKYAVDPEPTVEPAEAPPEQPLPAPPGASYYSIISVQGTEEPVEAPPPEVPAPPGASYYSII